MVCKNLELLAPAGKLDVLKTVVKSGADAVYLGGKNLNMRMLRAGFNFSDDELCYAVDYVHQRGKKIYVTANNLYYDDELDRLSEYLLFLNGLGIDAIIVQDLAVVELCKKLNIKIPLHGSVQMGISNSAAIRYLEENNFERVILSRNLSLQEIADISAHSNIGIECFIHGEQCVSHTGQCYMSSFASNEGGNRGRCIKPCRWEYQLNGAENTHLAGYQYFLAYKDLCLYPHLVDLINAGVISFKIEGRQYSADHLGYIVSTYREALDNIMKTPETYQVNEEEYEKLQNRRLRNFSTGSFYKPADGNNVGFDGKREPPFISTSRSLLTLGESDYQDYSPFSNFTVPELTVKITKVADLERMGKYKINNIIIGVDQFRQNGLEWDAKTLTQAKQSAAQAEFRVLIETPRIVSQKDLESIYELRDSMIGGPFYGVVVNDPGSMVIFKDTDLAIWGGYGLNIANYLASQAMERLGLERISASLELDAPHLQSMLDAGVDTEVLVHGPLCGMITDYCLPRAVHGDTIDECSLHCLNDEYSLQDKNGQKYRILTDYHCRNHIFYPHDRCLFPQLPQLASWGIKSFRIDGHSYSSIFLDQLVLYYSQALAQLQQGKWDNRDNYNSLIASFPNGLSAI